MSRLKFCYFTDYEDGKIARMLTTEDMEIPVNIFIDNANEIENATEGYCNIDICGVGSDIEIYSSEEEYMASQPEPRMAVISMIPIGTFPVDPDDGDFDESPHILFTGKVIDLEWNPVAEPDEPNCYLLVETLELLVNLTYVMISRLRKAILFMALPGCSAIWRWKLPNRMKTEQITEGMSLEPACPYCITYNSEHYLELSFTKCFTRGNEGVFWYRSFDIIPPIMDEGEVWHMKYIVSVDSMLRDLQQDYLNRHSDDVIYIRFRYTKRNTVDVDTGDSAVVNIFWTQ